MPKPKDSDLHNEFLRLLAENEAAIRTFLRAILTSRSDAEEAFQTTLITLWEKFEEYDTTRNFKTWAFGIARFKALSIIRDRQREKLIFGDSLVHQFEEDAIAASDRYLTQQEVLDDCLLKLPQDQRDFVLTAYTKGTRIDQLAKHLGRTPMSLYKKLQKLRKILLECVQQTMAKETIS
jgi:RNA polymerase sigma-70 factor (ECF subfamily)